MNELVKVIEQDGQQLVDARDLHEALGVKSQFTHWIDSRIKDCGYIEGEDFFSTVGNHSDSRVTDYMLTMPAAMMIITGSNSEKGFKLLKWLMQIAQAWNDPAMIVQRAAQMTRDKTKHYGTALENFIRSAEKLAKDKNLTLVLKPLISDAYDLAAIMDSVALENNTVRRDIGAVMRHYGLDKEALNDLVFGLREKIGSRAFWELADKYEGTGQKLLSA